MAELTPVPAPRSPFRGWRGWAVGVVGVGILVAIVKPWGAPLPADAPVLPAARVSSPAPERPVDVDAPVARDPGRAFDPAVLGARSPEPDWTLITAQGRTDLSVAAAAGTDAGGRPDIVAGPVFELGTTDGAGALAIAHPPEASLGAVRLWWFGTDGVPRRVDLDEVPSPWPVDHVEVLVHRGPGAAPDRVHGWAPGLYRLDLLVEPTDVVRSVMLVVRPGADAPPSVDPRPGPPDAAPASTFQPSDLRILPNTANLWAVGGFLSGWHRDDAPGACRVSEIWRATDPRDACWPVPIGPTDAIGVNLDTTVTGIALALVDPLPGPAGESSVVAVGGRRGLAYVQAPAGGLSDGIYRLDVATTGEALTWYLEVGPIGRAVAEYYAIATSR